MSCSELLDFDPVMMMKMMKNDVSRFTAPKLDLYQNVLQVGSSQSF